jgi:putative peptide zinc metalloprotease protein
VDIIEFACVARLSQVDSNYLLAYNGRSFHIGKIIYEILLILKSDIPVEEKLKIVERNWKLSEMSLTELIRKNLLEKIEQQQIPSKRKRYIFLQVELIKGRPLSYITEVLHHLYKPFFFKTALASSLVLTLIFFSFEISFFNVKDVGTFSDLVFIFSSMVVILLFHEFGHVSALKSFKIESNGIGFGFYLIFPVLFADVTRAWELESKKRMIINFGGVYFQLLFNSMLILLGWFFQVAAFKAFHVLIITNTLIMAYSLNPFFRNDGYWLFSDFFKVPNLLSRANQYPRKIFNILFKERKSIWTLILEIRKEGLPLFFYSLSNYLFISFFIYYVCFVQISKINSDLLKILEGGFNQVGNRWGVLFRGFLLYFLIAFILVRYIRFSQSPLMRFFRKPFYGKSID